MNGSTYCVRAYVAVRDSNGAMFIGRHKLTTNFIYYLGTALNIGARWIRNERREKKRTGECEETWICLNQDTSKSQDTPFWWSESQDIKQPFANSSQNIRTHHSLVKRDLNKSIQMLWSPTALLKSCDSFNFNKRDQNLRSHFPKLLKSRRKA